MEIVGKRKNWGKQLSAEQYKVKADAKPLGYSRRIWWCSRRQWRRQSHLIRQVTGVGRNRQVMTEYINTSWKFQKLEKWAKKK